jgi:hypothetical protein
MQVPTAAAASRLTPDGPDATVVTEIYDCSRAPEEDRAGMRASPVGSRRVLAAGLSVSAGQSQL